MINWIERDDTPRSGLSDLTVKLADIRSEFERWYMSEMDTSALFEHWSDTDYYEDSDIQRAWRGYQAGVLMSAN